MSQAIAPTLPMANQQIVPPRDMASQADNKTAPLVSPIVSSQSRAIEVDTLVIDKSRSNQGDRLLRIEGSLTEHKTLATSIRQTDSALDAVNSKIQTMKANLAKIVKNYPPFSIDSKERMEILRSFVSLRKEIDSMTIPPPPPQPGEPLKSVIWQQTGLAGILPGELATNASDAQVRGAHDQLGSAAQAISAGKQELRQTVLAMR